MERTILSVQSLVLILASLASLEAWVTPRRRTRTTPSAHFSTKKDQQDMVNFIQQPADNLVGETKPDPADWKLVETIVRAADARKASDIVVLHVQPYTTLTSYMVLVSGNSRPQNQAIAAAIRDDVELPEVLPQGTASSGWMVLDYPSVMVHIMTPKSRLFYNVEGQWKDKGAESMDISSWLVPNGVPGTIVEEEPVEEDPFWS